MIKSSLENDIGVLDRIGMNDPEVCQPLANMVSFLSTANMKQVEIMTSDKYLTVVKTGRGLGKTMVLSYILTEFLLTTTRRNAVVIAPTQTDANDLLIESEASGIAAFIDINDKKLVKYDKKNMVLTYLPTMSKLLIFGATNEDKVRGRNADLVVVDEFASLQQPGVIQQAELTLREKVKVGEVRIKRMILTSTPKNNETVKYYISKAKDKGTLVEGSTMDNIDNLDEEVIQEFINSFKEGSLLYRQEILGEVVHNADTAIATEEQIKNGRKDREKSYDDMIISIDPAVSSKVKNSDTGIILLGLYTPQEELKAKWEERYHGRHVDILGDYSVSGKGIDSWGEVVKKLTKDNPGVRILVEANQGGELIRDSLLKLDNTFVIINHHAHKAKRERAFPLSVAYQNGEVHHIGILAELEDQLMYFDDDDIQMKKDRVDALAHAYNFLTRGMQGARVLLG